MRLPQLPGYQYEELLGEDSFGWSFVSLYGEKERRVVRLLKAQATSGRFLERYFREISAARGDLRGIAPVFDFDILDLADSPAYATPFYGWRSKETQSWQLSSLKRVMHLFEGDQALDLVAGLADSIASVHERNLFHGGLKPASIFLTGDADGNREVRIGDFGQIFMGGLQFLEAGEMLFYVSPEQLASGEFSGDLGFRWDLYAFGVTAFQLLTGHLPRLDRLQQQCLEHPGALESSAAIAYGGLTPVSERFLEQLDAERPVEWPDDPQDEAGAAIRSVIEQCLEFDPDARPESMRFVATEIARILSGGQAPVAEAPVVAPVVAPAVAPEAPAEEVAPEPVVQETSIVLVDGEPERSPAGGDLVEVASREETLIGSELTGPIPVPEAGPKAELSRTGRVGSVFAARPALAWQLATVGALVLVVGAGGLALKFAQELRAQKGELAVENAELQASVENVEKQAAAYRRAMREKQKSSDQLLSELNEAEDKRSRLLGEAKLARQILRQTQDNGDEFFRLVLENRDTDVPGFREERDAALDKAKEHYERLVEVYGDAPDFIVSTANALFYLGRIYREQGEFGKSLASFGEAERRYMALLDDSSTTEVDYVKNLAIAKSSLGELSMKNAKHAIARHYFTESSRYWAEARSISPPDALECAVRIHENSLAIVECELAIDRLEAALDGARSIGAQILKLQEEDPEDDRIVGALAKSFALVGGILEAQGEKDLAKEAYTQASNLFGQAVKLNAAVDAYRLGLGNNLARVGLLDNDVEKLEGAVEILGKVVALNPYEANYQRTLADVYGVLAANQRDGGRLANAIELEKEALSIIQPIIRKNPAAAPADLLYSYSLRLAHLAELLGDNNEFDSSRAPLQEAIIVLEKITDGEDALPQYDRALARARGLAGFACLKSGDKSEAREHLELAKSEWESYMAKHPDDSDAEQAVRWADDQLKSLQ